MSFLDLLKKKPPLPQKDFYTYNFFEHSKELEEAIPEKEALLRLPVEERTNMLAQKITIHHCDPDGGRAVLAIAPYLMRFPVDNMIELLKDLPEQNQKSLLNTYVEEQGYAHRPFLFILPGGGAGYERMGIKRTVYERCLLNPFKAKKMEKYVSSLSPKTQSEIDKKLRKDFTHPYTKKMEKER